VFGSRELGSSGRIQFVLGLLFVVKLCCWQVERLAVTGLLEISDNKGQFGSFAVLVRGRGAGQSPWGLLAALPRWKVTATRTSASFVNKRQRLQLLLLLSLHALSAGRGGEGEGIVGDGEAGSGRRRGWRADEVRAAARSTTADTECELPICDASRHSETLELRLLNLLRRPVPDGAVVARFAVFLPSGVVPGEEHGGRRLSPSLLCGEAWGPDGVSPNLWRVFYAISLGQFVILLLLWVPVVTVTAAQNITRCL
jgi:hypothetical protein